MQYIKVNSEEGNSVDANQVNSKYNKKVIIQYKITNLFFCRMKKYLKCVSCGSNYQAELIEGANI